MTEQSSVPFVALQSRDFRLLWFGRIPSLLGTQMQSTAIAWHVYSLLEGAESSVTIFGRTIALDAQALGLGSLGLMRVLPILLLALIGGIAADTYDRRKIMLVTETIAISGAAVLTFLTLAGNITLPLLYLFTALTTGVSAFQTPAQQSLIPNLVPKNALGNAVSMNTILYYVGSIAGSGATGLMIAWLDIGYVYLINTFSFLTVIIALSMMSYRQTEKRKSTFNWASIVEGMRYTHGNKLVWSTMLMDFWATFFSGSRTMLPLIATRVFGMGEVGFGLLSTAQPIGAVVMGLIMSAIGEIRKQGPTLLISVGLFGLATMLFGFSDHYVNFFGTTAAFVLGYIFFALTGATDTVSSVIRGTIRQMTTPDELRGRMTSVNMMFFMGGPQLGEVEAGFAAALVSAPFAIVTGGLATIVMAGYMTWQYPILREYDK
ncbi:MAG: MFS transporter [Candidatus Promineifilaceae bacterium]